MWISAWLDKVFYQLSVDKEKSIEIKNLYTLAKLPIAVNYNTSGMAYTLIGFKAISNSGGVFNDSISAMVIPAAGDYTFNFKVFYDYLYTDVYDEYIVTASLLNNGVVIPGTSVSFDSGGTYSGSATLSYTGTPISLVFGDDIDVRVQIVSIGGTGGEITVKNDSYFELIAYPELFTGGTVIMSHAMGDVKQIDVLKDFLNHWNLVLLRDDNNAENIIVLPYDDWIDQFTLYDFSNKLDISKPVIIKPATEWLKAEINFEFLKSEDDLNRRYRDATGKPYGSISLATGIAYTTGKQGIFSILNPYPASLVQDTAMRIARYYKDQDNPSLERIKPQIFFFNGKLPSGDWWFDDSETNEEHTEYPNVSNWLYNPSGKVDATSQDLNFAFNFPFDGDDLIDEPTDLTAYIQYYLNYNFRLYREDSRIVECNIVIDANDFAQLRMNDVLRLDFNGAKDNYLIMKITGYALGSEQSTKFTLLKL